MRTSTMTRSLLAFAALAASLLSTTAYAQNADAGRAVFKQNCAVCHDVVPNKNRIGPSLFGIVGRKTGSEAGFHYSAANKAANITWDAATLDRYLTAPRVVIPGTTMPFAGLKDDQKRHDLVAYLATLH
jgi:cytochrome c2